MLIRRLDELAWMLHPGARDPYLNATMDMFEREIGIKPKEKPKKDPDVPQWKCNLKNQNPDEKKDKF